MTYFGTAGKRKGGQVTRADRIFKITLDCFLLAILSWLAKDDIYQNLPIFGGCPRDAGHISKMQQFILI